MSSNDWEDIVAAAEARPATPPHGKRHPAYVKGVTQTTCPVCLKPFPLRKISDGKIGKPKGEGRYIHGKGNWHHGVGRYGDYIYWSDNEVNNNE